MNKQKTGLRFISLWICLNLFLNSLWGCQVMPPQMTEIPPASNFQVKQVPLGNPHLKLELEARSLYEDLTANTEKIRISPLDTSQHNKYHYANFRIHSDLAWVLEIINANDQSVFSQSGEFPNAIISWWGEDLQGKTLPDGNYTVRIRSGGEKIENPIQIQHQMSFALGLPGFPNSATEVLVLKPNDLPKQLAHIRIEPDQTEPWSLSLKNPLGQEIFTVQDQGAHEFLWAPSYGENLNMGGDYLLTLSQGQKNWKKIIRVESWLMVALGDRLSNEGNLPLIMTPAENQHRWIDISVKAPANTVWKLEIQSQEYALIYSHRSGKGPKELHWTGNRWRDGGVPVLGKNKNGDWQWKGVPFSEPDTSPVRFPLNGNTNPSSLLLKPLFYPVPEGLYTISLHVSVKKEAIESLIGHPFYRFDKDFLLNRTTVKTQYSAPNELAIYTPPQVSYNFDILEKNLSEYKLQAEQLEKISREDLPDLPNFQVQTFQAKALELNSLNQPWYYTELEPQPGERKDPLYNERFARLKKQQEDIIAHLNWLYEANQVKFLAEAAPHNPNPDISGLRKLYVEKLFGRIRYQTSEIMALRAAYRLEKIEYERSFVGGALDYFFMFSAHYKNIKENFANRIEILDSEQQSLILRKANSSEKNTQLKLLSAKIQDNGQILIRGRIENPSSDFDYQAIIPFFGTDLENYESRTITPEGNGYFSMALSAYDFADSFFARIEEPGQINELKEPEIQVKLFKDKLSSQNMTLQLNEEQRNKLRALVALRKLGDQMIALGRLGQALAPIYAEQYGPGFKALAFQDCPSDGNGYSFCYPGVNAADEAARIALAQWELEIVREEQARFQQSMDIVVPSVILAEVTVLTMGLPLFFAELGAFAYTSEAALMSAMPMVTARTLSLAHISAKFLNLGLTFHLLSKMGKALFQKKTIQPFAFHIDELWKNTRSLGTKIQAKIAELNPCGFSIKNTPSKWSNPCFIGILKPKELSFKQYSEVVLLAKMYDEAIIAMAKLRAKGEVILVDSAGNILKITKDLVNGVGKHHVGPALTVVVNKKTGKMYFGTNLIDDSKNLDFYKDFHPILVKKINDIKGKDLGDPNGFDLALNEGGSHAEVYAVNQALQDLGENITKAVFDDLAMLTIRIKDMPGKKGVRSGGMAGSIFPSCGNCVKVLPEVLDLGSKEYLSQLPLLAQNEIRYIKKLHQASAMVILEKWKLK